VARARCARWSGAAAAGAASLVGVVTDVSEIYAMNPTTGKDQVEAVTAPKWGAHVAPPLPSLARRAAASASLSSRGDVGRGSSQASVDGFKHVGWISSQCRSDGSYVSVTRPLVCRLFLECC
jgi:hypothetical protein